jgi:hypothetical protein
MENKENQLVVNITDTNEALSLSTITKIFENPRQVTYSYLFPKELIKVASLSKREREIVLTSRIVKENRKSIKFVFRLENYNFKEYSTDIAV